MHHIIPLQTIRWNKWEWMEQAFCVTGYIYFTRDIQQQTKLANLGIQAGKKKVSYLPIGLVNYIACCKVEDFNGRLTGKRKVIFTDTTYYIYDKEKRILGYKKERKQPKYIPVFNNLKRLYFYSQVQSYINKVEFENYIDSLIGYRPKLILFEIYRNAVLPFQYDNDKMKYFEMADIHLE